MSTHGWPITYVTPTTLLQFPLVGIVCVHDSLRRSAALASLSHGKEGYLVDPDGKVARTGREQDSGAIVFSSLDDAVVAAVGRLT